MAHACTRARRRLGRQEELDNALVESSAHKMTSIGLQKHASTILYKSLSHSDPSRSQGSASKPVADALSAVQEAPASLDVV